LKNRLQQQRHPIGRRHIQKQIDTISDRLALTSLRPGSLVIIDEASLAGTLTLDTITQHAQTNGAKILLVGDFAQLGSVNAGGAFRLLATDRNDVAELIDVRRFHHDWEKTASVQLRDGNPAALTAYDDNNRITGSDREHILDQMLHAWNVDRDAGLRTIMIAADNETVDELNHRARELRVLAGEIEPAGVQLLSGVQAGVGDLITTRRNDRTLKTSSSWVRNGDQWTITHVGSEGSLTVNSQRNKAETTLCAEYVGAHVELGYATSAHRTQGKTFDTAHAYITPTAHHELLYVMTTRGRRSNNLYVDTAYDPEPESSHVPSAEASARTVLANVLGNNGTERSATETLRQERSATTRANDPLQPMPLDNGTGSHTSQPRLDGKIEMRMPVDPDRLI
jgi:ATP-dependent exoDNAse (exonuclease V) alpha subunit